MSVIPIDSRLPPNKTAAVAALKVQGLVKAYGKIKALDSVSFTLQAGKWVALLGENGAGKSTLIQLLCGLFSPDSGRTEVMGMDLELNPCGALAVLGVVFQQPTLDLDLTVQENLLYHAGLHGMEPSEAMSGIAKWLKWVGLEDSRTVRVRNLSGGNRRKVELVRALLHEPRVLLMDEATVGLDPVSRQQLLDLVGILVNEQGLCVLWTTHWVHEITRADQLLVLHKGKLLFSAPPQALLDQTGAPDLEQAFIQFTQGQ